MSRFANWTRKSLDKALSDIGSKIYVKAAELEISAWRTPEPMPFSKRTAGKKLKLEVGDAWGKLFDCAWFNFKGSVPKELAGHKTVLLIDINGELCVYDSKGEPVRGLTNVASEYDYSLGTPGKRVFPFADPAKGGESIDLWADAGCNDLFGNVKGDGKILDAHVAVCLEDMRKLYYDFEVLLGLAKELGPDSARGAQVYAALDKAAKLLCEFTDAEAEEARKILAPELAKRNGDVAMTISAVGHSHLDLGWLWPIRETIRKGARTFSTALANMELYPDYVFGASQAQLFQWIKDYYPGLYKRVKRKVAEGRFEVQGGMWVEADTNMIGGEAMVRQFLYGKKFFKEEFGGEIRNLWLPDVFGYSGALPQIMKKSGIDIFMTQKLSWSLVNKFPHHSFVWRGIDGSSVLAHMLPEDNYNSPGLPWSLAKSERNNADKCVSGRSLMLFGIGDGGGGPGEEHLERLARLKNLAGLPTSKQEPAAKFFDSWSQDAAKFSEWLGELYLERHQGTLTSQAANKRFNRKIEIALRELEWTAAMASAIKGAKYPAGRIETIWKEALLYQFHDILPGSSIKRVYDESKARYAILLKEIEALTKSARASLAKGAKGKTLFNSLSWARSEWVKSGSGWLKAEVPALGFKTLPKNAKGAAKTFAVMANSSKLENELLRVEFDAGGAVSSVWDKELGRETLSGKGNLLEVYYDNGDAWDFAMDYADRKPVRMKLDASKASVEGPFAKLEQSYSIGHSTLKQTISLASGSKLLSFATKAVWRERNSMLRTKFPVDVFSESANFEIQFGHIARPTHTNTSWDLAKDEVAAHKWADLSERDFGVALLNDCKYGHKVKGCALDLDLIRSLPHPGTVVFNEKGLKPGEPNHKYGDQCDHEFSYALLPHKGGLVEGEVVRRAYEFNIPLGEIDLGGAASKDEGAELSTVNVDSKDVVVESVKASEDGKRIVVRLYEASRSRAKAKISFGFPVKSVEEANLLEEPQGKLKLKDGSAELEFKPFEIKTLLVAKQG